MLDNNEQDLERLAEICLSTAKQIKEYLAANNHPPMTFDQNGPAFFPPTSPPDIQMARMDLCTAAKRLYDLAAGPDEVVTFNTYNIVHDLNAFRYVNYYKIAEAVPLDSTISYTTLAEKLNLSATQLRQMLRQLIQIHVFSEPTPNQVSHTASSKLLITHAGVGAFNAFTTLDTVPMAAQQIEALEHFGHGNVHPNQGGLNYACKTDLAMYNYYETQPAVRQRFSTLMTYVSSFPAMSNRHAVRGYDWSSLPQGSTVVDIAGNVGHTMVPIAEAHPNIKFIVQDLPKIVARATDPSTNVIPEPLRDRFTFQEHDFNTPQPVVGAEVYFLRMIMHDYSDPYCSRILRQIVPAMKKESRIVIMDQVSPPVGLLPAKIERIMRTQDLQMMLLTNARERDLDEWKKLIADVVGGGDDDDGKEKDDSAGEGKGAASDATPVPLEIKNVVTPPGSTMSLIEVGFVGQP
ncbi:hypothetical protein, variant [Exophiala mesophila]|uniref:O-methyltransferase C-terminal domain-containing protein n=1 Tax=Exophiala mesophila TaxID=212818 RepID=A0A0D1ZXX3_EXOME|nr:uncharacterized protein PV10_06231 [Exophiala mesophila]XP_016223293.1 hypothetical protein, variant [Exophiala mesophila]KIV91718.1 hypothetical protein PV10_06231 [Exophiala mesophila]KIV91719.1 hypothetical protein, variant [Exophiala mesophila]